MEVIENTAIKVSLPCDIADRTFSAIDKCEIVSVNNSAKEVLVYWDYDESVALAQVIDAEKTKLNVPEVPSPMIRDYKWPGL